MFLAAYFYYKRNQKDVDTTVEIGKDEAIRALSTAGSTIRTRSTQVFLQARRCYPSEETASSSEVSVVGEEEDANRRSIASSSSMTVAPDIFRDDVRQEWIDATFGKDFYAADEFNPPRQGVGEAGIASYVTFGATIPPKASDGGDKVGVTLSRIAIGLYARKVEPGSEAYCAGVKEGSILVDVNGMGMLGEPSRQALERLWQYEGVLDNDKSSATDSSQSNNSTPNGKIRHGPLAMRFYKSGQSYTIILFSRGPFGISWAPCGNFALVQKTYSFASKAGARRGCLVASVNGRSIRDMDHQVAAAEIRNLFIQGEQISMTFCYTPAASRSGFFERAMNGIDVSNKKTQPQKEKRTILSADGVEVRTHPVEYSLLWSCVKAPVESRTNKIGGSLSELAARVVAGELEAPTDFKQMKLYPEHVHENRVQRSIHYSECPQLPKVQLLTQWDALHALVYCLQVHEANYDEDQLSTLMGQSNDVSRLGILSNLTRSQEGWKVVDAFLLQWVSILCFPEEGEESPRMNKDEPVWSVYSKELSSMLLGVSQYNDDFCQRLHFVLRSYTATLEGQRTKDDSTRNLLTLLQALDRLRAAQRQLASQLTSDTSRVRVSSLDRSGVEKVLKSNSDDSMLIAISPRNGNSPSMNEILPKKSKSVFKLFHKKNKDVVYSSEKSDSLRTRHSVPDLVTMSSGTTAIAPSAIRTRTKSLTSLAVHLEYFSVPSLLENMTRFLTELDGICDTIERSLLKSISQKIADWALQPWSASKESELAKVTEGMREGLKNIMASGNPPSPLVNPVHAGELLVSVDSNGCYILPSAHFPLLLTFNVDLKPSERTAGSTRPRSFLREEQLYRTKVEIVGIRGSASPMKAYKNGGHDGKVRSYVVQAAVAGNIQESGRSIPSDEKSKIHTWQEDGILIFDTRSYWGAPQTLSLGVSAITIGIDGHDQVVRSDEKGKLHYSTDIGHCWVDMKPLWERIAKSGVSNGPKAPSLTVSCHAQVWSLENTESFDQYGELTNGMAPVPERLELELRVTNEILTFDQPYSGYQSRKRMLLYKHDDDLRQEMFAIQFINICDLLLKASGLDLKLLTFRCIPVGFKRGFIEWIPGSVPLSDICQPFGGVGLMKSPSDESENRREGRSAEREDPLSGVAKAGLFKYQSLPRSPTNQSVPVKGKDRANSLTNNPIQDFFRSMAYDPDAPYFIQREVMENYVKSCAGYCVITYLLGVGDRHLDNLLLHQSGHFFHCDYSFILGIDPKKYLPMRITEHMIQGMGGRESDNYARFLSLAGATFIALRRHENVRVILSMVRLMVPSVLPDVSVNQNPHDALDGILERLHLDLSDEKAISYMEQLIEESVCSKLWIAVDAIHSIGKRF